MGTREVTDTIDNVTTTANDTSDAPGRQQNASRGVPSIVMIVMKMIFVVVAIVAASGRLGSDQRRRCHRHRNAGSA